MKHAAIALAALTVFAGTAAPAQAQEFNWHLSRNLADLDLAMRKLADYCADGFGYTALTTLTGDPAATRAKMKAHLYLSSHPGIEVNHWIVLFNEAAHPPADEDDLEQRAANAVLAADADPSSLAKAKAAYVSASMDFTQRRNATCVDARRDPFLADTYITGAGDIERYRAQIEANFDRGLKEVRTVK